MSSNETVRRSKDFLLFLFFYYAVNTVGTLTLFLGGSELKSRELLD
jgi:hypothetical protein